VLGAAVAAEPALAADGGTAVVAADPDAQRPAGQSLKDQFRQAFTPGALVDAPIEIAHIMIPPC
jgi:hypothetical protein